MPNPKKVLVLAPMTSELKPLIRCVRARRADLDGLHAFRGRVGEVDLTMVRLGVGPAAARATAARALAAGPVDHVVVSGIAGGLDPSLAVGRVMVPDTVLDLVTGDRFEPAALGDTRLEGTIGVADHLITSNSELDQLVAQGVVAVEMESSGVARACAIVGVPWTVFRVISDRPDEGLTDDAVMDFLRPDGSVDSLAALRFAVTHPGRIRALSQLARDSSAAASKAAQVALRALGWTG